MNDLRTHSDNVPVLASASPRRSELLKILIDSFDVRPADIDETELAGEAPADYAVRVAGDKARAVAAAFPDRPVVGSDTAVVVDGAVLGKPADPAGARTMLERLSGRWHEVYSAVALWLPGSGLRSGLNVTRVRFAPLPAAWIDGYIASGEPMDKAGAYAIQGRAGAWIPEIRGSHSAVVGLPLFETAELLRDAGLALGPVFAVKTGVEPVPEERDS
ncbi:MAG: Maf family protein [Wenzhouxiangellaceae bacterium]|nr:Maf family protein [Wenzhouxiangellaceae bacterium]